MPIPQFTAGQVLTAAQLNVMVDAINAGGAVKVASFSTSGTWTVPTGVTYAVAHIRGGGGGVGWNSSPGAGGTSSVAFAGGTVSATGGVAWSGSYTGGLVIKGSFAGTANSGKGANSYALQVQNASGTSTDTGAGSMYGQDGAELVYGAAVTAGASITVTVGAGGTAGATNGAAGGSGFVWIEYTGG